jgi:hypothetical protein
MAERNFNHPEAAIAVRFLVISLALLLKPSITPGNDLLFIPLHSKSSEGIVGGHLAEIGEAGIFIMSSAHNIRVPVSSKME